MSIITIITIIIITIVILIMWIFESLQLFKGPGIWISKSGFGDWFGKIACQKHLQRAIRINNFSISFPTQNMCVYIYIYIKLPIKRIAAGLFLNSVSSPYRNLHVRESIFHPSRTSKEVALKFPPRLFLNFHHADGLKLFICLKALAYESPSTDLQSDGHFACLTPGSD